MKYTHFEIRKEEWKKERLFPFDRYSTLSLIENAYKLWTVIRVILEFYYFNKKIGKNIHILCILETFGMFL